MDTKLFFENFDALAEAPGGVPKLRELILQLAVRGKLVEQDEEDEDALNILEDIVSKKKKLIQAGNLKEKRPANIGSNAEIDFVIPKNWHACKLGELGLVGSSSRVLKKDWQTRGIPFLRAREVVVLSKVGVVNNDLFITQDLYDSLSRKGQVPQENDIMITGVGTIGVPYVVKKDDHFYFKDASVLIFKNIFNIYTDYLLMFMRTPYWIETIHQGSMGTTVHTFTISRANEIPIPLPPLNEQKRIVAKVDELMARCDELEEKQNKARECRVALNKSALHSLTSASNANDFSKSWRRVRDAFDFLYDTPETINDLRQAILQLAVMGKLVENGTGEVTRQIEKAHEERLAIGKKPKASYEADPFFEIPDNWCWEKMDWLCKLITDGEHSTPPRTEKGIPMGTAKNVRDGYIDLTNTDYVSKETAQKCWKRCKPKIDDILMVCVGATTGRMSIVTEKEDYVLVRSVALIRPNTIVMKSTYAKICIQSPLGQQQVWANVKQSAQPCLYLGKIKEIIFPIPSLDEQEKIVDKVNELMSICDTLEEQNTLVQSHSTHLLNSIVDKILTV